MVFAYKLLTIQEPILTVVSRLDWFCFSCFFFVHIDICQFCSSVYVFLKLLRLSHKHFHTALFNQIHFIANLVQQTDIYSKKQKKFVAAATHSRSILSFHQELIVFVILLCSNTN